MRTIAIYNRKGGVGKTTTTAVMAYCLANRHRKRVLVIDGDSQGNISTYFGVRPEEGQSLMDLLEGSHEPLWEDLIAPTTNPRIHIIPADNRLMMADLSSIEDGRCNPGAIEDLCSAIAEDNGMDYVLIDCPPGLNAAGAAAMRAADDIIIPAEMEGFSAIGARDVVGQVEDARKVNPRLRIAGVLATKWRNTEPEQAMLRGLRGLGLPVFRQVIRLSAPVPSAMVDGENLLVYSPTCAASVDYKRAVQEYLDGLRGGGRNG